MNIADRPLIEVAPLIQVVRYHIPENAPGRPELTFRGLLWGFGFTMLITAVVVLVAAFICAIGPDRW